MKGFITILFTLFLGFSSAQDVFINEVLTQNKGLLKSEDGKSYDYIELYNASSKTVDLSGFFLSDDKDTLKMYPIPSGTAIGPKNHLLFWANGNGNSKELNTNFKLNQKGESIYLSFPNGTLCHKLKYKRQFTNVAFGLLPDGSTSNDYQIPTPNSANKTGRIFAGDLKGKTTNEVSITLNKNSFSVLLKNPDSKTYLVKIEDNKTDKILYRTKLENTSATIHFATYPAGKYNLIIGKDRYRILKK